MTRYEVCRAAPRGALLVTTLLLVAACGAPAAAPQPSPSPIGPVPSETSGPPKDPDGAGGATVLIGTFGGDGQLEGGCAWLDAEGKRYELQLPEGYTVTFSPLEMIGREGEVVATEGDRLHLLGRKVEGIATICQVGPVFKVGEVHPLS